MATRSLQNTTPEPSPRKREIAGISLLALALFLGLSLTSSFLKKDWMGTSGDMLAHGIYFLCGFSSIFLIVFLLILSIRFLRRSISAPKITFLSGIFGGVFFFNIFLTLLFPKNADDFSFQQKLTELPIGGLIGSYGFFIFTKLLGTWGTALFCITGLLISGLLCTTASYEELLRKIKQIAKVLFSFLYQKMVLLRQKMKGRHLPPVEKQVPEKKQKVDVETEQEKLDEKSDNSLEKQTVFISQEKRPNLRLPQTTIAKVEQPKTQENAGQEPNQEQIQKETQAQSTQPKEESDQVPVVLPRASQLERNRVPENKPPVENYIKTGIGMYQCPSLELLDYQEQGQAELDRKAMLELAQRLEKSLADYQVKGRVSQIHPGPVVTMYEFVPSPGTKLSKITALSSDLAMALEALRVRIVAPIPGKAAVGIEVPNTERETVYSKEIFADASFAQAKSKLTLALGKDIAGVPVCVDLAKMPHLLIAGTTGSGKSVAINVMICSLLFRASPEDVKVIMIDPKMLELSIYEGIPHLLLPVVTDPKKANLALKWAVDEMDRRYDLISKSGVRDIGGYNRKVEEALGKIAPIQDLSQNLAETPNSDDEMQDDLITQTSPIDSHQEHLVLQDPEEPPRKLPYIVVIIDEFADLMMVASKEVEVSVARIAQKARAAGIHLILATQRPSVDVITGLIKANFPSRVAFQVTSRIDSRTILDTQGAENLLGMGDMLFTDRGQALRRIHGSLITDEEVHRVVSHLKSQGRPVYNMEILKPREEEDGPQEEDEDADELYDQAVRIVVDSRQASISMVQRRLRIGYNRAARMVEKMEKEGIVSAADGAKGREVLVQSYD